MQTFMPYASFEVTASLLDDVRLRKQIMETSQILDALTLGSGYVHHPMTLAWRGHMDGLRMYGKAILDEYRRRGGTKYIGYDAVFKASDPQASMPVWFGNKDFHAGHRGHLFRKDPVKYECFALDAASPLLYPCDGYLVERVVEGRFRPFPNTNDDIVYKSVKAAKIGDQK